MSLYVILEALGIGSKDEIILPAFTCVVVPNAMIYHGIKPVYVDIEPDTYNIDVSKIKEKITPQTKAIYAQHTFGIPCNMDCIARIAKDHGLIVIEDCAHALGASLNGRKVGSLGHVAYFSTDHSKVISTSTGGMITTKGPGTSPEDSGSAKVYAVPQRKEHQSHPVDICYRIRPVPSEVTVARLLASCPFGGTKTPVLFL